MNVEKLSQLLKTGTRDEIESFCQNNNLDIKDNKIYPKDKQKIQEEFAFWDKRQLVKKINLNSLYGALLNPGSRFFDQRLGQSTTLTGRSIARHMAAQTNQVITGDYDHVGESIIYGDSVAGNSVIRTSIGKIPIEELFKQFRHTIRTEGGKEYAIPTEAEEDDQIKVLGYNAYDDTSNFSNISYVMKHKTTKQLYEIETEDGEIITVTEDHSIIVDRGGFTTEVKPAELRDDDVLITVTETLAT